MMFRSLLWILVSTFAWSLAPQAAAQPLPPQDPVLSIEPGMHTAVIQRIGVDASCRVMATASYDKTLRLWQLPDGKALHVLRLPIGSGNEGQLYATAVSPDGSWVAAGGWDAGREALGGHFIYIFHTATGAVAARLGPLENVLSDIAISRDGRTLAATIVEGAGLRVWSRSGPDLGSWQLIAADRDYGGRDAYGAVFDRAGTLYTVAFDSKLRRYAPGYQAKPASVKTRAGSQPYAVAIHPSSDRVAVGFNDIAAVEVYDAATLARRFQVDTKKATNGDLGAVAWSADGKQLFAGGRYVQQEGGVERAPILVWDRAGQGKLRTIPASRTTILQMLPCGNGIAVGAGDPAVGLLAPDGRRVLWKEGVQADLRGQRSDKSVAVSTDGRRVRFGLEANGASPVLFDLAREQLSEAPTPLADLRTADTTSLPVTDWTNHSQPQISGTPIPLQNPEMARSLAIASGKDRFVLGADWSLRGFDRSGKQLWRQTSPQVTWSVNISGDGKMAVAGYGDGTVRWHRMSDGVELLALFVRKDDRRWVAWTPKGYYMASPGAESLIGWHVNRGWNETAQFYPADRFREQFNRPDIVKLALETLDEVRAIEEANRRSNQKRAVENIRQIAPPQVVIQDVTPVSRGAGEDLTFRSSQVTISYEVFSETGKEIVGVDVHVNKAKLRSNAIPTPGERRNKNYTSGKAVVTLQPRDVVITLVARDEDDRASQPVSITLRWDGPAPGQVALPRLRALFVGNNAYPFGKLNFAVKDAEELAALFRSHKGKSFSSVDAKVLTNATRADVIKSMKWLEQGPDDATLDDVNLLFLAGHGKSDARNHFYYMTVDTDPNELEATAVSKDNILSLIRYRKGAMVVMLDACHSGATSEAGPGRLSQVDMNRTANELGDASLEVQLYASAEARQYSFERRDWGHGAFTKAMIKALSGAADPKKRGFVDVHELGIYLREEVKEMTEGQQTPTRRISAQEMSVVKLK